jgi:glycosyltransferase involved in cell wall biosynthesis
MKHRPSYLVVIASSCQMHSGTGTAVFDWIRYAKSFFQFSVLMDTHNESNFRLVEAFCKEQDITLYPSRSLRLPGCVDTGVMDVSQRLQVHCYDYIECISWANAATNLSVLSSMNAQTKLVFTPHSQPMWTLANHDRYFMVPEVFSQMLKVADFVFVDSMQESRLPEFLGVDMGRVHCVPLGVNTDLYKPENVGRLEQQILCICDCREARKRVDVLLAAFAIAYKKDPALRLVIGGKGSD